jgi:hypothetical protein
MSLLENVLKRLRDLGEEILIKIESSQSHDDLMKIISDDENRNFLGGDLNPEELLIMANSEIE